MNSPRTLSQTIGLALFLAVSYFFTYHPCVCFAQVKIEFGEFEQSPGWFESWAFQGFSENSIKMRWKLEIEAEINRLSILNLREDQKEKLRLAGSGDIARFLREVQKARDRTKDMTPDQNNIQEIQKILAPIQSRISTGLFRGDSLLHKMIVQILSPEQFTLWQQQQQALTEKRLRVLIHMAVANREQRIPLVATQREALCELAWSKVRGLSIPREYQTYVVSIAISTLTREQLEAFLDPDQVNALVPKGESLKFEDQLASLGITLDGK